VLSQEEITIVKNSIAKGCSDQEMRFCLTVAKRYKLDPFKQQIWFVKRWDSSADDGKGGKGAYIWTPQVGINGLLFIAARDHKKEFGSVALPEYGPIVNGAPEWAKVKVWKKGESQPTEAQAWWSEYAPADLSKAPFWRKMPRRMIGKCATALAIRQAYPDLGGLYIPEESLKINEDFTPEGRTIVEKDASILSDDGGSLAAAQAVAQRKIAEHNAKKTIDVKPETKREEAKPAEKQPDTRTPSKVAEIVWPSQTDTESAYVRVVGMEVPPSVFREFLEASGTWSDAVKMWSIPAAYVPEFFELCERLGYACKEVSGLPSPKPQQPDAQGGAFSAPSLTVPPVGMVKAIKMNTPKGKNPNMEVLYAGFWCWAFDSKMFEHLSEAKDKECELIVERGKGGALKVMGIKRIGVQKFGEDGLPEIQMGDFRQASFL
jgi:hypothetical protein